MWLYDIGPKQDGQNLIRLYIPEGGGGGGVDLIFNESVEALTSWIMIPSGTNSHPAEVLT